MTFPTRRRFLIGGGATFAALALAAATRGFGFFGELEELGAARVFAVDGLAIRGHDPVAYFPEGRPVPGDPAFETVHDGATWRFASAANRAAFVDDPDAYAPRYGGFCAWAIAAKGKLYSTQPDNWTIVDGRLYLNYDDAVQARWEKDIPGFIDEADSRWPALGRET